MQTGALYPQQNNTIELPNILVGIAYVINVVKKYLGYIGLALILIPILPLLAIFFLFFRKRFNSFANAAPQMAKESELPNNWENTDWKEFKKIQYRVEILCSMFEDIVDDELYPVKEGIKLPNFIMEHIKNTLILKSSLLTLRKNLRSVHQMHLENEMHKNVWNQFDDIWDYETPDEDKQMMFELNTKKSKTKE